MDRAIDIEAWRRDGEQLWAAIQANRLVVFFWNNPWRRFAAIGGVLLVAALVVGLATKAYGAAVALVVVSLPFAYTAAKYFRVGVQTGGLYSFFSEHGFGVGCDADRLLIPYSSISLPDSVDPGTVNHDYIVLPVIGTNEGVRIEQKAGDDLLWNGKPYTRGIASVLLQDGTVRVRAYPNEMLVHLFSAIYPLSIYLSRRKDTAHGVPTPLPATD